MLFNSYIFILAFLPLTLILYFMLNRWSYRAAQIELIVASFIFYGYRHVLFVPLLASSIIVNYSIANYMGRGNAPCRKGALAMGCIFNLGLIYYFKYFNFFINNVNLVLSTDIAVKKIILPLGISFFTFQQISYLIDSYEGKTREYDFIEYALFVCFFPQLVAGPIVLHSEMIPQFRDAAQKNEDYENIARGIIRFSIGLAKKVLIADTFSIVVNFGVEHYLTDTPIDVIVTMLAYTFQIYFDFSGYCDMALGIAKMFNISLSENFNSPYKAMSINDFWRRWHITLTRFLRKYIYYPLGGSRKGALRTYLNIMVVFIASGIWHGANWTFILWGILHGLLCVVDRFANDMISKLPKIIRWGGTFAAVNVLWLLFRADSVSQWLTMLHNLCTNRSFTFTPEFRWIFETQLIKNHVLVAGVIFLTGFIGCLFCENNGRRIWRVTGKTLVLAVTLTIWCILSFSGISEFLYFNF